MKILNLHKCFQLNLLRKKKKGVNKLSIFVRRISVIFTEDLDA